jgi:hypothetical protein
MRSNPVTVAQEHRHVVPRRRLNAVAPRLIVTARPFHVVARLDRATCINAMERAMARSSRAMTRKTCAMTWKTWAMTWKDPAMTWTNRTMTERCPP